VLARLVFDKSAFPIAERVCRQHLNESVQDQENVVVLVACLTPNGAMRSAAVRTFIFPQHLDDFHCDEGGSIAAESASLIVLPPAQDYRIVGVANLALTESAVDEYAASSLTVPQCSAYLSNMAVDISFRRCSTLISRLQK
jgi:hypothetical protein